ncbi:hypothetical protein GUA87_16880 [Sneathiella sp. P13V-1]|uniref:hypothetical protein n=1 Tax=Sneathiella sp. P13V-1 TaxID=2697366 RepID=UPI00187B5D64|nr:hypothetical protein [Sneathiella sp. P13V-1]MBE7638534.1 hypothetical protein [Sneathiella sp. P13V-1]
MIVKKIKLNPLQSKTLVLLKVLARDDNTSIADAAEGGRKILSLPHAHGNHMHVGEFVVSAKDASGLTNPSVWKALARKGFVKDNWPNEMVITKAGLEFSTGLEDKFMSVSDH